MKRLAKWLALIFGGLLVIVVAAVLVVPNVINWNNYKAEIAELVRSATGRDLRIDGDIRISMWSDLDFSVSGIRFANAPGASPSDMLSVGGVAGKIALWPLLGKELDVKTLIVKKASVHLAVDKQGNPNWVFGTGEPTTTKPSEEQPAAGTRGPGLNVRLGEFRLEGSDVSYVDAATEQKIEAKDISLTAAMADPARPFAVNGQMTVNAEPVTMELLLDSPRRLLDGEKASAKLKVASKWLNASFDGHAQERPAPGLDGVFDLSIPSVGQLASWLGRPLEKSRPDPGMLKVRAEFATDGARTVLKEATLQGAALTAKATGSLDASASVMKLAFDLETGVLDVDRYLPPASRAAPTPSAAAPPTAAAPMRDPFAALSDKPIDLSALKQMDADVKVMIAGVKALGYEVGRTALTAAAKGGVLKAELSDLTLYGGDVRGTVKLDGSGKALDVDTSFKIDHVTIDKLAAAAGSVPATGVVSAVFEAKAQGVSPRALAESLHGRLALDLGGVSVKEAAARAISGVKLDLEVPAPDKQLSLKGNLIYNGERVDADVISDPPRKIFAADKFAIKLVVASKPVTVSYDGAVQQRPVPGLNGTFDLDVPSVGNLASWVGRPLDAKQPDPGPLKAHAVLASEGAKLAVKEATVTGKALKAKAEGNLDGSQKIAAFDAKIDVQQADLNAYLPPPAQKTAATQKTAPAAQASPAAQPAGWSTEPLDLAAIKQANGQAQVQLAAVRYRDLDITQGQIKTTLKDGVLKLMVEKLALAQGTITSDGTLDGSGPVAKLDYRASVSGVQAMPLLKTFADTDRLSGTIAFQADGKASGRNQKELIETLNGAGQFKVTDGAVHGINLASALRKAGTLGLTSSPEEKTDFAELSGTFTIKNGVLENHDMKMLAPLIRLSGTGTVPMPPQTVDYAVEAKLVASLQGQTGSDALAGIPIPIKITGPWSSPSYQVDWKSVFTEMAKDPSRMKNLPANLQSAAKGFGVLPGQGAGGGILNVVPQLGGPGGPAPGATPPPSGQPPSTSPVPKALKNLFGN